MSLDALENYYDLDDIISTNEKIPCKIEIPIYRLGNYKLMFEYLRITTISKSDTYFSDII